MSKKYEVNDDSKSDSDYDISNVDEHFNLFCKNIDPNLKKILGIEEERKDSEEKCDWKPPKTHGLNNSEPIIPKKQKITLDVIPEKNDNSKSESDLYINSLKGNKFINFCKKLNPSLRKLIGLNYEEEIDERKSDWKPPKTHGLNNSKPIISLDQFGNKYFNFDIFK